MRFERRHANSVRVDGDDSSAVIAPVLPQCACSDASSDFGIWSRCPRRSRIGGIDLAFDRNSMTPIDTPVRCERARRSMPMKFVAVALLVACVLCALPPDACATEDAPAPSATGKSEREANANSSAVHVGVLGGIGFPRPLTVEALVDIDRILAIGGEYGFLPKTTISSVELGCWAASADARLFPFRSGFFIGVRGGYQHLDASATVTVGSQSRSGSIAMETLFVNPRIGFLWMGRPGLAIGFEVGVQIPVSTSVSTALPAEVAALDTNIKSTAETLGRTPLPTIDLLRLGVGF
jgi:hypothetical protein